MDEYTRLPPSRTRTQRHNRRNRKYVACYDFGIKDGKRLRKYRQFPMTPDGRRARDVWLEECRQQARRGIIVPRDLMVGDVLMQWVQAKIASGVRMKTATNYELAVRCHLAPRFGGLLTTKFTAADVDAYLADVRRAHQGALPRSVHAATSVLRMAFRWAQRRGLVAYNPMDAVVVRQPSRPPLELAWGAEEVRLFLATAKRTSRHYPLYLTALYTGMRQAELLGLRWRDVDLLGNTLHVRQVCYRIAGRVHTGPPKTVSSSRTITRLDPSLVAVLLDHRAASRPGELVFCQASGRPLHAQNLCRRDFRRTMQAAGVPRIRFHDLRHVCATQALRAGVPLMDLSAMLGHSSPKITLGLYAHALPAVERDVMRHIAAAFGGLGWQMAGNEESVQ